MKYHMVTIPTNTFRGRKKLPGNLIFDPSTSRLGVFVCYCGGCNAKVVVNKETLNFLGNNFKKSQKSFAVRILLSMAKKLE